MTARIHTAELSAQPDRVIAQLFLPGEEWSAEHSRAGEIIARVMAMPPDQTEALAAELTHDFGSRHPDVRALFLENADVVSSRLADPVDISVARRLVLGASFTAEYAVEGAALCNPSAVEHPDQTGLAPGQRRVAVALRSIGEGHRSSIEFAEAIIGPGRRWTFVERTLPLWRARIDEGDWSIIHFRAAVEDVGIVNEISHNVLQGLPDRFTASDVEASVAGLPRALSRRADSARHIEALRELTNSVYRAVFSPETSLSQRVLTPVAAEERHGMEDARFVRFTDLAGTTHYRGTYTAYDGRNIAPRLIITSDLREFDIHRLTGDAAQDKGMALFPRPVDGRYLALSRTGGENISLAESLDGVIWNQAGIVHAPTEPWEIVQTGNCGPPLETAHGWIVLVHGVGPMRRYSLGALLLDIDDPTTVLGRTATPILQPVGDRRDGYVPNVVYSCGGVIVDDVLWVPIGIGDARIGVCSIGVDELLAHLVP
ncbi:glycosylase [Microbacterium sp. NPDC056057]|uniref:glycoside hydrolase family 130 protein n=1 Tax=Microbacterium sp. NPDC056057 TaxID=3345699 RepID=UPI0035D5A411